MFFLIFNIISKHLQITVDLVFSRCKLVSGNLHRYLCYSHDHMKTFVNNFK